MNNHLVKRIERELGRVEAFRDVYRISEEEAQEFDVGNNSDIKAYIDAYCRWN